MERTFCKTSLDEVLTFLTILGENNSPLARAAAVSFFRRYYSMDHVEKDIFSNKIAIQRLLKMLDSSLVHSVMNSSRIDAAWAITNVVCQSKELCHLVVENGGIELLTRIASTEPSGSELKIQCYWAIGNIAADCARCKEACRNTPIVTMLANSLHCHEFHKVGQMKNVIWCTLNVVRGGIENVPLEAVGMILQACEKIIHYKKNNPEYVDYVKDAIWVVASLADDMHGGTHIEILCSMTRLLEDFVKILLTGINALHHGSLRVLGNIATGNNDQTNVITNLPGFYEVLVKFLSVGCPLAHEAAWLTSNIAAGNEDHTEIIFTDNRLYKQILEGLALGEPKLKKECAWIITNLLSGATMETHEWLVAAGVVNTFRTILDLEDSRVVTRALTALSTILIDYPHFSTLVKDEMFLEKIKPHMLEIPEIASRLVEIQETTKNFLSDVEEGEATIIFSH